MKNIKNIFISFAFAAIMSAVGTSALIAMPDPVALMKMQLEFDQDLKNALNQKLVQAFEDCYELYRQQAKGEIVLTQIQLNAINKRTNAFSKHVNAYLKKKENLLQRRLKKLNRNNNNNQINNVVESDDSNERVVVSVIDESVERNVSDNSSGNNNERNIVIPQNDENENLCDFIIIDNLDDEPVGFEVGAESNEHEDEINEEVQEIVAPVINFNLENLQNQAQELDRALSNQLQAIDKEIQGGAEVQNVQNNNVLGVPALSSIQKAKRKAIRLQHEEKHNKAEQERIRQARIAMITQRAEQNRIAEANRREEQQRLEAERVKQIELQQAIASREFEIRLQERTTLEQERKERLALEQTIFAEYQRELEEAQDQQAEMDKQFILQQKKRRAEEQRKKDTQSHQLAINCYINKIEHAINNISLIVKSMGAKRDKQYAIEHLNCKLMELTRILNVLKKAQEFFTSEQDQKTLLKHMNTIFVEHGRKDNIKILSINSGQWALYNACAFWQSVITETERQQLVDLKNQAKSLINISLDFLEQLDAFLS